MNNRTEMRNALMPLLKETIAVANWNDVEWHTPTWRFEIIDGNYRFEYSIGSAPNKPEDCPPAYRPVLHDGGAGQLVDEAPLAGNLFVSAFYSRDGKADYSYSAMYNPASGESIEDWGKDFIRKVKGFE